MKNEFPDPTGGNACTAGRVLQVGRRLGGGSPRRVPRHPGVVQLQRRAGLRAAAGTHSPGIHCPVEGGTRDVSRGNQLAQNKPAPASWSPAAVNSLTSPLPGRRISQ